MRRFLVSAFTILALTSPSLAQVGFQGLGDLPGGIVSSGAHGVSADGSTVVGYSSSEGSGNNSTEAFRWTQATGMVGLGFGYGQTLGTSLARGVSGDGSVVVGKASRTASPTWPFRWTSGTDMVRIDDYRYPSGDATAVSDDGAVVVGMSFSDTCQPFRWTSADGIAYLGDDLPSGMKWLGTMGVSGDGSTLVGQAYRDGTSDHEAFFWTQEMGMVGLGDLPGGEFNSRASGVSANGSVVVGYATSALGVEAYRWTQETGMVLLGDLLGGKFWSEANGVSADGSVVVGRSHGTAGSAFDAIVWDAGNGMRSLQDLLTDDYGLDLSGWHLTDAMSVSADGRTIVGLGLNPTGQAEAWIATIPEPSTSLLLLTAATFILRQRRAC